MALAWAARVRIPSSLAMMMIMIEPNRRFVLASHTHGCTFVLLLVGRNKSDDSAWYEAEKINTHRWSPEKGYEYLVTWKGVDKDGKHEVTWEPAENATPGLVRGYNFMGEVATTPIMVGVNLWDIVGAVRARVAAGLAMDNIAKDKKADCRPRIHEMVVPELWSEALATAFLQLMTEPWKLRPGTAPKEPLTIKTYEDDKDGVITKQLELTDLKDVESFCAFEVYLGMACAIGLLRYDVGRKSNVDLMAVGNPILFSFSFNRASNMVTFTITFATVHFNGAYGTPTFPHMKKGMLKQDKHRNALVTYVREHLPSNHPLVAKGWTELEPWVHSLDKETAVPTE